jgi:hypothetical protein
MSKADTLYQWYKQNKKEFTTETNDSVIFSFAYGNQHAFRRIKPRKNKSGILWTYKGVLFVDETPVCVNVSNNIVYIDPIYLNHLPKISPVLRSCKEIITYLKRRSLETLPVDIETVSMIVERTLE